jgi:RNA polymerase sigma factor (sigma-70 family)
MWAMEVSVFGLPRLSRLVGVSDDLVGQIEAVYREEFGRFYRVAFAIVRDDGLAWDAVQEGFAGAIRSRSGFRGEAPLGAWLWRSVVNAAVKLSKQRRSDLAVAEFPEPSVMESDLSDAVELGGLSERQRLVVFLRYYADLDERTIGEIVGIKRGTVSATLHAALKRLRHDLEVTG